MQPRPQLVDGLVRLQVPLVQRPVDLVLQHPRGHHHVAREVALGRHVHALAVDKLDLGAAGKVRGGELGARSRSRLRDGDQKLCNVCVRLAVDLTIRRVAQPTGRSHLDAKQVDLLLVGIALQPHFAKQPPALLARVARSLLLAVVLAVVLVAAVGIGRVRVAVVLGVGARLHLLGDHSAHALHVRLRMCSFDLLARRVKLENVLGEFVHRGAQLADGVAHVLIVTVAAAAVTAAAVAAAAVVVAQEQADAHRRLKPVAHSRAFKELDVRLAADGRQALFAFLALVQRLTRSCVNVRENLGRPQARVLDAVVDFDAGAGDGDLVRGRAPVQPRLVRPVRRVARRPAQLHAQCSRARDFRTASGDSCLANPREKKRRETVWSARRDPTPHLARRLTRRVPALAASMVA